MRSNMRLSNVVLSLLPCSVWSRNSLAKRRCPGEWASYGIPDALSLCWHTGMPLGAPLYVCGRNRMCERPGRMGKAWGWDEDVAACDNLETGGKWLIQNMVIISRNNVNYRETLQGQPHLFNPRERTFYVQTRWAGQIQRQCVNKRPSLWSHGTAQSLPTPEMEDKKWLLETVLKDVVSLNFDLHWVGN